MALRRFQSKNFAVDVIVLHLKIGVADTNQWGNTYFPHVILAELTLCEI